MNNHGPIQVLRKNNQILVIRYDINLELSVEEAEHLVSELNANIHILKSYIQEKS